MKKNILLICSLIFAFGQTSCVNEGMEFDTNGGKGLDFVHFVGSQLTISTVLDDVSAHTVSIRVSSTEKSAQARSYSIQVAPSSTAIEGTHFNLSSKSVTIPANEYIGSVTLTVVIGNLIKNPLNAVLTLDSDEAISYGKTMTVTMNRTDLCEFFPSMLVGSFNYVSDDWDEEGMAMLEADPEDPYKIHILHPLSEDITWNENPLVINVDPETFSISGPKCVVIDNLAEWGMAAYTNYYLQAEEGEFDFCTGSYTITFILGCDQAVFGPYHYVLSR